MTPSNGFFLGGSSSKKRPPKVTYYPDSGGGGSYVENEVDSYGSPSAPVITNYQPTAAETETTVDVDSYGSPAAPVISYQPQSNKVKKSVTPAVQIEDIDDGYGAPLAPVVSAAPAAPVQR